MERGEISRGIAGDDEHVRPTAWDEPPCHISDSNGLGRGGRAGDDGVPIREPGLPQDLNLV